MLSRREVRNQLAAIIKAGIPTLQAVYSFKAMDLQGQSPVITLASNGLRLDALTFIEPARIYFYAVHVLVLLTDIASGWTSEDAENLNDDLVLALTQVLYDNKANEFWNSVNVEDRTFTDEVIIGGVTYLDEVIIISVGMG